MIAFHRQLMSFALDSIHDCLEGSRVNFWRRVIRGLIAFPLLITLTGLGITAIEVPSDTFSKTTLSPSQKNLLNNDHLAVRRTRRTQRVRKRSRNPNRNKRKKNTVVSTPPGKILWQNKVDGRIYATPTLDNELVYVSTTKGGLYAFERDSGVLRWQKTIDEKLAKSAPVPRGSRLFLGTRSGDLIALDKASGRELWRFKTNSSSPIISSPVVETAESETVYFTSQNGLIYALDTEKGTLQWQLDTESIIDASPLLDQGILYVGDYKGHAYAVDAKSGKIKWTSLIEGPLLSTPVVVGDSIYFSSGVGAMFALNKNDGLKRWSYTSPGGHAMIGTPAIVNEQVYIGDVDGTIGCVNNAFGIRVWQRSLKGAILSSIQSFNQSLLVGTGDGKLVAIHPDSGKRLWKLELNSVIEADMALSGRQIFLGSHNGTVFAVELSP